MIIDYDRIVYFGDSLTDSDELFAATSAVAFFGIPPLAAGYDGQFSNGDVYADLTPGLIGVEGGEELNYAVGGAQLLTERTIGEVLDGTGLIRPDATVEDLGFRVDFKGQIDRFLADEFGNDLSNTAVSVFIGFNDFNDFVPTSPETALDEVIDYGVLLATTALTDTAQLVAAGAGTVILHTLGDPSIFPATQNDDPALQGLGTAASLSYNAALTAGAASLEALGADVIIVDFAAIFAEIEADFESFGFQTLDDTVVLGDNGAGGPNPAVADIPIDQIAFFDSVHPTAAMHGILAGFEAATLQADRVTIGGEDRDVLVGKGGDNLFVGGLGHDIIQLRSGDDIGLGGRGNDLIQGHNGADLLAGGAGADKVFGGWGADIVVGGTGWDFLKGGRGDDLLIDGPGAGKIHGGTGDDVIIFTEAALRGGDENLRTSIKGGAGEDTLIIRVEDADDVSMVERGNKTVFKDLGLTVSNVENIVIVEGTDLSGEDFYSEQMAVADLWNFI